MNGSIYQNTYVQIGAFIILSFAFLGTMALFAFQTVTDKPTLSWEYTLLITGLTMSANVLGYHQGATTATTALNGGGNNGK